MQNIPLSQRILTVVVYVSLNTHGSSLIHMSELSSGYVIVLVCNVSTEGATSRAFQPACRRESDVNSYSLRRSNIFQHSLECLTEISPRIKWNTNGACKILIIVCEENKLRAPRWHCMIVHRGSFFVTYILPRWRACLNWVPLSIIK